PAPPPPGRAHPSHPNAATPVGGRRRLRPRLPPRRPRRRGPGHRLADGEEPIRGRLERVRRPRIPAGRDHAKGVGPPIYRTRMNVLAQETTQRGARLLVAHLESLDPQAVQARERLEERLGSELARKLVFALA